LGDFTTIFRQKYARCAATLCKCREQHIGDAGLDVLLDDAPNFINRGSNKMLCSVQAARTTCSFAPVGTGETWRAFEQFLGAVALAGGEVGVACR
jgi:hypothetical protein